MVTVRLSWTGVDEIDTLAAEQGVDRSTMIRTLLAEAVQARRHQPTRRTQTPS